ncbi:hypothetical protein RRG08_057905 [Elysia crispata]|uniref:Uncharacterized protein n=1 Tax=Elysia crispata TaxID=231223 RepID=A0AAE0ZQR5_9GAST|nr:hypothetical protein RRG08_057905 [Elysia crispata]
MSHCETQTSEIFVDGRLCQPESQENPVIGCIRLLVPMGVFCVLAAILAFGCIRDGALHSRNFYQFWLPQSMSLGSGKHTHHMPGGHLVTSEDQASN